MEIIIKIMLVMMIVCVFLVCDKKTIVKSIICIIMIIAILLPTIKKEIVLSENQKIINMNVQVGYTRYSRHIDTVIKTEKSYFVCEGIIPQAEELQKTEINTFLYIFNKKIFNYDSYTILKINDIDYYIRMN